jgi:hypothetical protein
VADPGDSTAILRDFASDETLGLVILLGEQMFDSSKKSGGGGTPGVADPSGASATVARLTLPD